MLANKNVWKRTNNLSRVVSPRCSLLASYASDTRGRGHESAAPHSGLYSFKFWFSVTFSQPGWKSRKRYAAHSMTLMQPDHFTQCSTKETAMCFNDGGKYDKTGRVSFLGRWLTCPIWHLLAAALCGLHPTGLQYLHLLSFKTEEKACNQQ